MMDKSQSIHGYRRGFHTRYAKSISRVSLDDGYVIKVCSASPKPNAATAKNAFLEGCINMLLAPQQIQIDQDSAFRGVFEELRCDLGRLLVPIPADAHVTHGNIQRRMQVVRSMAEKVFTPTPWSNVIGSLAS